MWPKGTPQSHVVLFYQSCRDPHSGQNCVVFPWQSCGAEGRSPLCPNCVVLPSMAAMSGFKSLCQSSSVPAFPTPIISYTCQHSSIIPSLLGYHSESRQVWLHVMEPTLSKLSLRHCNQGDLPPSYILDGSPFHPPGSEHGHSYLTYL
ncbi:hypothetical protein HJG60_010532 [Phyllostomus discolor]|uniref:Uncharacterized protein n=1 Tax=Phyllostomus discolor TaxID=89673 RepID=A0A834AH14_9CHIR|nr:hypothetical protein HJG60_010532 [Phyllostomus discolor]